MRCLAQAILDACGGFKSSAAREILNGVESVDSRPNSIKFGLNLMKFDQDFEIQIKNPAKFPIRPPLNALNFIDEFCNQAGPTSFKSTFVTDAK
jgi:hypothetical protein